MPLTVRLDPKAERALNALAKRRRVSRSEIVREALAQYDAGAGGGRDARGGVYDDWLDVVGVIDLGVRRPQRTTGEQFAMIVREQARGRRAR